MGAGLILLVVLAVAGAFLASRFGLPGFVLTLANRGRSRFHRTDSDGQAVFTVTPARPSLAALAALAVGVIMLANVEKLEIIALFGLIPLTMGALAFPIGARHRQAATITITPDALRSRSRTWPLAEIADFNIRRGSRINADEPPVVVHRAADGGLVPAGKSTSAMISRALNRRMIERSYLVSLRGRSGSDETVLSGGLTLECAEALQHDLRESLSANAKASIGAIA